KKKTKKNIEGKIKIESIFLKKGKGKSKKSKIKKVPTRNANNYLLKNNLAEEATSRNIKKIKAKQKKQAELAEEEKQEAEQIKEKLEEITVKVTAKAGEGGHLFGSITNKQIAEELNKNHNIKVDRRKI